MSPLPVAISVGDPGGVGPLVALRAAREHTCAGGLVLFGDASQLLRMAREEGLSERTRQIAGLHEARDGQIGIIGVGRVSCAAIERHMPTSETGAQQLAVLERAASAVRAGQARALVTGPTSKEAIVLSGSPFVGQTEHLARSSGLADDAVTMMFLGPRLRVALVTTHLAVSSLSAAITMDRVRRTVVHMAAALRAKPPARDRPRIVVLGLNPHAGEGGLFGREELDVIGPALVSLRAERPFADGELVLEGPAPAESALRAAQRGDVDGVVAMMHDQATIASKLLDWGSAVNVTWGLPFVRTSVDHGVAYDAARAGTAQADGMVAALSLADALTGAGRG